MTEFDRYEFPVAPDKTTAVEGRLYTVIYYANDGITVPSALQIARNYENAGKSIGGQKVYEFEDGGQSYVTLRVAKQQAERWAQVEAAGNGMYNAHVIFVVGHTDNAGAFDHNLALSKDRAQAGQEPTRRVGRAMSRPRPPR